MKSKRKMFRNHQEGHNGKIGNTKKTVINNKKQNKQTLTKIHVTGNGNK